MADLNQIKDNIDDLLNSALILIGTFSEYSKDAQSNEQLFELIKKLDSEYLVFSNAFLKFKSLDYSKLNVKCMAIFSIMNKINKLNITDLNFIKNYNDLNEKAVVIYNNL